MRMRGAKHPVPVMTRISCAYQIVVIVADCDRGFYPATMRSILENSHSKRRIHVLANGARIKGPSDGRIKWISRLGGHEELLVAALNTFVSEDLIVVRSGVIVPGGWDARLCAAAGRRDGI